MHARHAVADGHKHLMIKPSDTDVLVIAVSWFPALNDLGLGKLWLAFGQGADLRWIPVHAIYHSIWPERS